MQVELISQNVESNIEVKQIITLGEDALSSEILVCNSSDSSVHFTGAVISHLTASTPEATYAIGLEGSDFFSKTPLLTDFSLIHPSFGKTGSRKARGLMDFTGFFSGWGVDQDSERTRKETEGLEGEEEDGYKNLAEEMSRIYTSAPRDFTVLDRVWNLLWRFYRTFLIPLTFSEHSLPCRIRVFIPLLIYVCPSYCSVHQSSLCSKIITISHCGSGKEKLSPGREKWVQRTLHVQSRFKS